MKPHIIVELRSPAEGDRPHWSDILQSKAGAEAPLTDALGAVLDRFAAPVWTAREHLRAGPDWTADERASGLDRIYRLILRRDMGLPDGLIDAIRLVPEVAAVHRGRIGAAELPAARPAALGARRADAARRAIGLELVRAITEGDRDVLVAVLDTGLDLDHPELRGRLRPGRDFVDILHGASDFIGDVVGADADPDDEVGHGTHVAGVIGATGEAAPRGVAPACPLLPVRVLAAMQQGGRRVGAGLVDNIDQGVKFAVDQGAQVINMSLGVRHEGGGLPHRAVIEYAERKGAVVVAAAGNDGARNLYYPGALDTVIAVGSAGPDGAVSPFSTFGPQVFMLAPGEDIYSTGLRGGYALATGTSHAAPFVAGACALLIARARALGRRLRPAHLREIFQHTSDRTDRAFKTEKAGYGRLNLPDAMRFLEAQF
ncbi:MAG: S8 family serine peptidase [Oceanicaulis sp.]